MKRYTVQWTEHHEVTIEADTAEQAEAMAVDHEAAERTYKWSEIDSVEAA